MTKITGLYLGEHRVDVYHGPSADSFVTDAPPDHDGKGEGFAPTDLLAASLGSCLLTAMGIEAKKSGIEMTGASVVVDKKIAQDPPRRVGSLHATITLPGTMTTEEKVEMKWVALTCPVLLTLQDAVDIQLEWLDI